MLKKASAIGGRPEPESTTSKRSWHSPFFNVVQVHPGLDVVAIFQSFPFFAAFKSALASSRQPRFSRNAFQILISSSLGFRPHLKHHSRISSSDPPFNVRSTSSL